MKNKGVSAFRIALMIPNSIYSLLKTSLSFMLIALLSIQILSSADRNTINNVNSPLLKSNNSSLIEYSSGKDKEIITIFDPEPGEIVLPTLYTNDITNITGLSATSGGNTISSGNGQISANGIVWSTNPNPTIDNYEGRASAGSGTNDFYANLTNLNLNTYYYVRAYATNEAGTGYGNEVSFVTLGYYPPPTNQSSNIGIYNVRNNNMTLNWTNGNGYGTMVVVKTGNDFNDSDIPQSGEFYEGYNNDFSNAPEVVEGSGGGRIIYYGSSSSVLLEGLTPITRYRIRLFAYRGNPAGSSAGFNQNTSRNNPVMQRTARFRGVDGDEMENSNTSLVKNIFPLPAKDYLDIEMFNVDNCEPIIRLFNIDGQEITINSIVINTNSEEQINRLNFDNLVSGYYSLVIQCNDEIIFQRIMIIR